MTDVISRSRRRKPPRLPTKAGNFPEIGRTFCKHRRLEASRGSPRQQKKSSNRYKVSVITTFLAHLNRQESLHPQDHCPRSKMSFFYPQQRSGYNQSPFFDLFEQQESPFCSSRPEPYDSYPRRHHSYSRNPPHRHSAGLFHPQDFASPDPYQTTSNVHPLHQLRQQKLDRDAYECYPRNLGYSNSHHPLHQLRQQKLERDALEDRLNFHHPSHRASLRHNPTDCGESLRAERARRLAEAKMRQLGQTSQEEEMKVELTLPDGRQCVVPISWAKKMQSKYPGILTNSMMRPHFAPSPPPPSYKLDQPLATDDSDHDSDFFVLDPTQDPAVPDLTSSAPPLPAGRRRSASPQPPKHSPEEMEAAACLIQQHFRAHRSMKHLAELDLAFDKVKSEFSYPSLLDLKFIDSPDQSDRSTPTSTKLAFNHPVNRSLQAFEEGLTQLQIKADAILSRGNPKIKDWRKKLIIAIEAQLEQLDRFKTEAWTAQHLAHLENLARNQKPDDCHDVEMNDEVVNTDAESVSSDHLNVECSALATPLSAAKAIQSASCPEDIIIPAPEPGNNAVETLLIPTSSTVAPSAFDPAPPSDTSLVGPSCILKPLVTSDGDLICPAPITSMNSEDILVSPA
ncbi:hypothetical protein MJO29_003301 [Puccinia striiformis f. sp. tritici]|nr:hypothetical protein MJO29_003301 [Puccinia striiformis f. sp. tritici]